MLSHSYKLYVIFAVCLAAGLGLVFLISNNYYPILLVNNQPVSAHEFWAMYQSAARYYQNVLATYSARMSTSTPLTNGPTPAELKASVLDQLIESNLIAGGLKQELGKSAEAMITERVGKYRANPSLAQAARALYGLSYADFEREVLVPQAQKDILSGRLFLKGQKIEAWLAAAKSAAQVTIFSPQFSWDGKRVIANNANSGK